MPSEKPWECRIQICASAQREVLFSRRQGNNAMSLNPTSSGWGPFTGATSSVLGALCRWGGGTVPCLQETAWKGWTELGKTGEKKKPQWWLWDFLSLVFAAGDDLGMDGWNQCWERNEKAWNSSATRVSQISLTITFEAFPKLLIKSLEIYIINFPATAFA